MKIISVILMLFNVLGCTDNIEQEKRLLENKLWYTEPAREWTEALPSGNGRLGAMIFGKVDEEKIQLNEESLWAGIKINNNNPEALKHLKEIQELLLNGENLKAHNLSQKYLLGTPPRIRSYQTLGDLYLKFKYKDKTLNSYKRELNLSNGIITTNYVKGSTEYIREVFTSAVDDIVIIHLESKGEDKINLSMNLNREIDAFIKTDKNNNLTMHGQVIDKDEPHRGPLGKHMKFSALVKVMSTDGSVSRTENRLNIQNADKATIIITAATDYNLNKLNFDRNINPEYECNSIINKASTKSYNILKENHIEEYTRKYDRVSLSLGNEAKQSLPTNVRLQKVKDGEMDNGLVALYFQYGRYLLLSSSRAPGVLPANLQGIWNNHIDAPWGSDYHTNINLQMNYWPAEMCNLSETVIPLNEFFLKLLEPGSTTAKEMYGADGWMMHHVTDPFGRTGLMDDIIYGTSPLAGAWMALTFWRHYEYNKDQEYLKTKAYPIMKEAAKFILDFLIEDKNGYLVTAPSMSPENAFINPIDKKKIQITYSATIDVQIITELFNACIKSEEILFSEPNFSKQLRTTLKKLPPVLIGNDGTIREWVEDYEEAEPGHRHMSHLFGLHPGTQITPKKEELFEAAKKTIEKRLANGGGHTGWSRAWMVNFYARLLDPENAYIHLIELLRKSTLPNLFDSHPPFQIDGNFGGTAGIAEMLLESQNNVIHILPSLPKEWSSGNVKGLKAKGNYIVDIEWKSGKLNKLVVNSKSRDLCKIKYKNINYEFTSEVNSRYDLTSKLSGN